MVLDDQGGPYGVKGDPSCTHEGQAKHETEDEDSVLIKSSEGDAGASDKTSRGIGSRRDLPAVNIARWRTHVIIRVLASGGRKWRQVTL